MKTVQSYMGIKFRYKEAELSEALLLYSFRLKET